MNRETIRESLQKLLEEEMCEEYGHLDDSSSIREDLNLDSVDMVSLVLSIENQFQVSIPTDELEQIVTVGDLLDVVEGNASEPPKADAA